MLYDAVSFELGYIMKLEYQSKSLDYLKKLADNNVHSLLISGICGSGKTYLASKFATFLNTYNFTVVKPTSENLRSMISDSYKSDETQVICLENLDRSIELSSQTILKFLEEPRSNIYIVVTAINPSKLASTILSRVNQIYIDKPSASDVWEYAKKTIRSTSLLNHFSEDTLYLYFRSPGEVDLLNSISLDEIRYYEEITTSKFLSNSIDFLIWNLGHFKNNKETNLNLVFRYLYVNTKYKKEALESMLSLESGRVSKHAVLGNFAIKIS